MFNLYVIRRMIRKSTYSYCLVKKTERFDNGRLINKHTYLCKGKKMGLFSNFKLGVVIAVGLKNVQNGSDILINRHTNVDTFTINKQIKSAADEVIKKIYLNEIEDISEEEAALLKLGVFYSIANDNDDEHMKALFADAIKKISSIGGVKIRSKTISEVNELTSFALYGDLIKHII